MSRRSHCAKGETKTERLLRFAVWFASFRATHPTAGMVCSTFDVSRATAHRWLAAIRDAQGGLTQ